jgi:ATPase subunit of ABC transporter with duplicated ATPase domains
MGDPKDDTDFDALMEEMGELQDQDRRGRRLDARQPARDRDGGAALPAGDWPGRPTSRAVRSAASRCTRLLIQKPSILLLDEPTNHLDAESVQWLENHLKEYAGAC